MKIIHTLFLISLIGLSLTSTAQNTGKRVELGEKHNVTSSINGKTYELIIQVPNSYSADTSKYYPVVYFCDGYYDFPLFTSIYGHLIYDKRITECFLVGFSYPGEGIDYGPLRFHDYLPSYSEERNFGGGAAEYLKIVKEDFIKYMETNFRVDDSWRALGGNSAGGMFCLYSLLTEPNLFNALMAIGPAAEWDNKWIFKYEEEFAKANSILDVSLFMTGGEKEFPWNPNYLNSIKEFDRILQSRAYTNFRYKFKVLDNASHAGSKPEGYTRGMQFIFEPLLNK
ncbi:MAG: alpha/beta hydrolase-fold protein [Prolixibacteraceae bacterium]|jgi:predicted alpha/beta superfamily hydrolase|nr:alpha/beta hydrolase-fold protein [Prolixibacteraceae bacterium]